MLVSAFRADAPHHAVCRDWLARRERDAEPCAIADLVLSGFLRVATHPYVFDPPTPLPDALAFAAAVRGMPGVVPLAAGPRHWEIFTRLVRTTRARGNRIPDAYLAALAIEHGAEWVSLDTGFRAYPGLRWTRPTGE